MSRIASKKLRIRRRLRFITFITTLCAIPIALAALLVRLSYVDALQITAIEVTGTTEIPSSEVEMFARSVLATPWAMFFSGSTMLTYHKGALARTLTERYGLRIASTTISATPRMLSVHISERVPSALWCHQEYCAWVDSTGLAYEETDTTASSTVVFLGTGSSTAPMIGARVLDGDTFQSLLLFIMRLKDLDMSVTSVTLKEEGDITLVLDEPLPYLQIATTQRFDEVYDRLVALLSDKSFHEKIFAGKIQYFDARFGNKIYYKEQAQ